MYNVGLYITHKHSKYIYIYIHFVNWSHEMVVSDIMTFFVSRTRRLMAFSPLRGAAGDLYLRILNGRPCLHILVSLHKHKSLGQLSPCSVD